MKFIKFLIYEPRACKEDSHHHTASWSSSCYHLVPSLHPHLFLCCSQLFPHPPMSLLPLLPLPYTQLLPEKGKIPPSTQQERKLQNLDSSKTAKPSFQGMQENTQLWKFLTLDMTSTIQKNLQGNFLSELNPDGLNWTDDDPERIILGLLCRWAAIAVQVDWTQVETKGGGWMCSKGAIIRLLLRVLACSIFRFITLMVGAISIDGYWACFQRTKQL